MNWTDKIVLPEGWEWGRDEQSVGWAEQPSHRVSVHYFTASDRNLRVSVDASSQRFHGTGDIHDFVAVLEQAAYIYAQIENRGRKGDAQ